MQADHSFEIRQPRESTHRFHAEVRSHVKYHCRGHTRIQISRHWLSNAHRLCVAHHSQEGYHSWRYPEVRSYDSPTQAITCHLPTLPCFQSRMGRKEEFSQAKSQLCWYILRTRYLHFCCARRSIYQEEARESLPEPAKTSPS